MGLNGRLDRDVEAGLVEVERFQRKFFAAARQGNLKLESRCSSTADRFEMAIFRRPSEPGRPDPPPPAIPGDPPAALWIHNSFLQQVLTDASLLAALKPLAEGFLTPDKPAGPDVASASPSDRQVGPVDWKVGWSQDGNWLTVSFAIPRQRWASATRRPAFGTVADHKTTP